MLINPKVEITANHEACAAYGEDANPQAMGDALRAVFAVLEREGYHRPDECPCGREIGEADGT